MMLLTFSSLAKANSSFGFSAVDFFAQLQCQISTLNNINGQGESYDIIETAKFPILNLRLIGGFGTVTVLAKINGSIPGTTLVSTITLEVKKIENSSEEYILTNWVRNYDLSTGESYGSSSVAEVLYLSPQTVEKNLCKNSMFGCFPNTTWSNSSGFGYTVNCEILK